MNILEVKDVKKQLGKREIIKGISFNVKQGEIFGFLGPNGAGKTTTIRMLVGLISPNSGSIKIDGHDIKGEREMALSAVGAVVENPELYTYLSGRENLMQIARIRGISKAYVEEIIELVELKDRIGDKVKKYSLGMKQRLGLAAALIAKPKLLILDEPTNGLDPTGIMDFRKIVRKAAHETNTAVFISSHILSEVQTLCDTVAFINNGIIQSVESINGGIVKENTETIILSVKEIEKCREILKSLNCIQGISFKEDVFKLIIDKNSIPEIIFKLAENKIHIEEVYKKHVELEDRYLEIVEGGKVV
ncbi:ABC transporter ATP-binding protein [Clostridium sp. HMP27]|uniref:ABC transporter ATP-binding protein n=1 Tax=Clostridium sp. HMP27 TaxID=1487921 RepID=UPI00052C83BA|nr:ABC transporter ATP-binding protein [Clostridium sp. HMP27]KGK85519.1 bacitracin ABC transporter ATP-binding protein [Clostridium sp. HMP27]